MLGFTYTANSRLQRGRALTSAERTGRAAVVRPVEKLQRGRALTSAERAGGNAEVANSYLASTRPRSDERGEEAEMKPIVSGVVLQRGRALTSAESQRP